MRLFIAIPLEPGLRERAAALLPETIPGLRRVRPENMHITLAFIGWVTEERLADADAAAQEAVRGVGPFRLVFEGAGRFPERGRPRVIWLGIGAGAERVRELGAGAAEGLRKRGVRFDDRPLAAHLTLARVHDDATAAEARTIAAAVESLAVPDLDQEVSEVIVFESQLSPRGPRYFERATARLVAGSGAEGSRAQR